jgi:hypothetical protein
VSGEIDHRHLRNFISRKAVIKFNHILIVMDCPNLHLVPIIFIADESGQAKKSSGYLIEGFWNDAVSFFFSLSCTIFKFS